MNKKQEQNEKAYNDFVEMIRKSWTYAKLDETERKRVEYALLGASVKFARGDYKSRTNMLHATYVGFLTALGFEDGEALGVGYKPWRE